MSTFAQMIVNRFEKCILNIQGVPKFDQKILRDNSRYEKMKFTV